MDASNKVRIGNEFVTSIGGQVSWTNFSDERIKDNIQENVPGLAFIKALRPVTYHFSVAKENELLLVKDISDKPNDITNSTGRNIPKTHIKDITVPYVKNIQNFRVKEIAKADGKYDIEEIQFTGLLAQEVEAAAKKLIMISAV